MDRVLTHPAAWAAARRAAVPAICSGASLGGRAVLRSRQGTAVLQFGCTLPAILCIVALLLGAPTGHAAPAAGAASVTVTLYNTGDIHEISKNLARIVHFVRERKKTDPNVLFLDAGDVYNRGEIPLMVTRGEGMNAIMQVAGYDARIFGNHGGSFGTRRLIELIDRFEVPLLAANAIWPEGVAPKSAPPYRVFALEGVRVGVIGTLAEGRNHRCDDLLKVKRVDQAVAPLLPKLRQEADIIVLLTHVGTKRDRQVAAALAANGPGSGVDVIIGGHDHAAFKKLVIEPSSDTLIQHSGALGMCVGEVVLRWDGQRIAERSVRIIPITKDMPEDARVKAVRDHYMDAVSDKRPLAGVGARLSREHLSVWAAHQVLKATEADVVLIPRQLALRELPHGDVTALGLLQSMPRLAVLRFTVPNAAGLKQLFTLLLTKNPTLMAYGPDGGRGRRPILVAYPCVAYDRVVPAKIAELKLGGAAGIERMPDVSLWQIALQAARQDREIMLPISTP